MKDKEQEIVGIAELVEQMKNGDEAAFASLYTQTYKFVYSRAKSMFTDEEEALDLVQEVYLALYRNVASIQSNENIFGWLKTTVFYQGTKMLQKKRKEVLLSEEGEGVFETIPDEETQIEEDYMNKEDIEVIRTCIDRLSDEQRTVLLAYYYDNLKVNEIAEMLSVSEGTIKSRLYLARKHLKLHVEEAEKKRGYKLHSFGAVTLALALRAFLQANMETAVVAEETVFVKLCQTLNFKAAKTVGKGFVSKIVGLGVKKLAVSVTGIVATTAVVAGVTFGTGIDQPKETDILPESTGSVQEQELTQETDTDEVVNPDIETNNETGDQKEESISNKEEESSAGKPGTSDTTSVEESEEEAPSTPDSPRVEEESEEETPSTQDTPGAEEESEEEIPNSSSQDSDKSQNDFDGSSALNPEIDSGANDQWAPFF